MTTTELLLNVIGEAQDDYLEEVDQRVGKVRRRKRWTRTSLIAACVIVIVGILLQFGPVLYEGIGAHGSCNYASDGIAAGGYFYYEEPGDGFFRYTPYEGSVRLTRGSLKDRMRNTWYTFTANDYGFYYTKGDWIYRIRHGETESEKLYRYEEKVSMPFMYPAGANDIAVDVYYEVSGDGYHSEIIIIDGITGERKATVIEENITQEEFNALPRDEMGLYEDEALDALYSRTPVFAPRLTYTVGDRTLELVLAEGSDWFDCAYYLTENGKRLTEDYVVPYDVGTLGDSLVFAIGRDRIVSQNASRFLIVRPDGTQQTVSTGIMGGGIHGGEDFYFTYEQWYGDERDVQIIKAVRINDGEEFELKWNAPEEPFDFLYADGRYIWLTFYDRIACYRVVYEDGVPTALRLIDADIGES